MDALFGVTQVVQKGEEGLDLAVDVTYDVERTVEERTD